MEYFPVVVQVVPQENYHVHVYFEDGKIVDYDATELLEVIPEGKFKDATVLNDTLAWDLEGNRDTSKCIDIDPFVLYELEAINHNVA